MKSVFSSTADLAHAWASQNYPQGRSGNIFFNNKTIYSYGYHFPIAKFVTNSNGDEVVLFTERGYSNSTAKHIGKVRAACSNDKRIYCYNPEASHNDNFSFWIREADASIVKLKAARKPELYIRELEQTRLAAEKYAEFFAIEIPQPLLDALSCVDKEKMELYSETKRKATEAREEKAKQDALARLEKAKKDFKVALKKWLNFETNYLHKGSNKFDFVRFNKDSNRWETSQAVQIPFELGRRLFDDIFLSRLKVDDKVLDFTVREVGKIIRIGCHTYEKKYLIAQGKKIYCKE
jgi:hypothetical protein